MTQAQLNETHARIMGRAPATWWWTYRGPDQRKEQRAIVLGMACPLCKGPVHNPTRTSERVRSMSLGEIAFDQYFECMNGCGWSHKPRPLPFTW